MAESRDAPTEIDRLLNRPIVRFLLAFIVLALLWQIFLISLPCPGDLHSASSLGWCAAATTGQAWASSPPFVPHYLSIAVLASIAVGFWYAIGALRRAARAGGPMLYGYSVAGFIVRFVIALAALTFLDWLVPRVQPCLDDYLYSPAAGAWCQVVRQPAPWPDIEHGAPLLGIALVMVYAWYMIESRDRGA
jgi:hypothetical protein